MNQIASMFTFDGGKQIGTAAGLSLHKGAVAEPNDDALSVWDTPQDATAGRIAAGMVSTDNHRAIIGLEHALMIFPVKNGQTIHHAAGSGWSKADMPTQTSWNDYLKLYLAQEGNPVRVRRKRGK
jgi:hypothetical protein